MWTLQVLPDTSHTQRENTIVYSRKLRVVVSLLLDRLRPRGFRHRRKWWPDIVRPASMPQGRHTHTHIFNWMMEIWDFLFSFEKWAKPPARLSERGNHYVSKKKKERASAEINVSRVHNRRSKYNVEKNPSERERQKKRMRKESERLLRPHQLVYTVGAVTRCYRDRDSGTIADVSFFLSLSLHVWVASQMELSVFRISWAQRNETRKCLRFQATWRVISFLM